MRNQIMLLVFSISMSVGRSCCVMEEEKEDEYENININQLLKEYTINTNATIKANGSTENQENLQNK